MSVYEALGFGYILASTAVFTAEVSYFVAKGVGHMHRLIQRAQTEENLDLERSLSIKREMAQSTVVSTIIGFITCSRWRAPR